MEHRSFPSERALLNTCIQAVINVAHAERLHLSDTRLGNLVRVHLGQTVILIVVPVAMPDIILRTPLEALLRLPGSGGNHERAVRCARLASQSLALASIGSTDRHRQIDDLVHTGTQAYKLAADAAASYDRWSGELWWELGNHFLHYRKIVFASNQYLERMS